MMYLVIWDMLCFMLCVMLETILKAFVGGNNIFKE